MNLTVSKFPQLQTEMLLPC